MRSSVDLLMGIFDPYRQPNIAARYSLAALPSDNTYILSGSTVPLIADRSGNSAVNGLVLNGTSGNCASSPDSAAISITGNIDVRVRCALVDWTPGSAGTFFSKTDNASGKSWSLYINTNGRPSFVWSADGSATINKDCTAATPFADGTTGWVRVTLTVNNGAGGNEVRFYTSTDGSTWTQLGTTVTTAGTTSIFDSNSPVIIGGFGSNVGDLPGQFFQAQIYNGIAGTLAFDANFTLQSKLATSFTESSSNAATVTINTSGDLGARICGARDLVQMTAAKMPAFSVVGGYNTATFDGSNDYMQSAKFSTPQPSSLYIAMSQVSWTSLDQFFDCSQGLIEQVTSTPNFRQNAGSNGAATTGLAVGTRGVVTCIFNAASSLLRVNLGAASTGDAGSGAMTLFNLGSQSDGNRAANITFNEAVLRSAADPAAFQIQMARALIRNWGVLA